MNNLSIGVIALALTLVLPSIPAFGGDTPWPRFRGPDANPVGADARLPVQWTTTENVEWSAEIPGRGWSSPIVTGGKVFVTAATTEGESKSPQVGTDYSNDYAAELSKQGLSAEEIEARVVARDFELPDEVVLHYFLYCLDLETGKVEWKREYFNGHPPGGRHRKNSFTSETPVTDGERVYVYGTNLGFWAFDLDGEQVWHKPLKARPMYGDFGTGASPILVGDRLIICHDNEEQQFIAAFDKHDGTELWRTNRDISSERGEPRRSGWTTPYLWTNELRTEIVTVGPGTALSYSLDGEELWRLNGMSAVPIPSPFAYNGLLYIDGGVRQDIFAIRPGAKGDISLAEGERSNESIAWSVPRAGTYLPTLLAYQDTLYVLGETGIVTHLDAKSGRRIYKARIDRAAGHFTSSPWAYNGKVFFLSEEGNTYVVAAGDTLELLHVNPLDEMALATPAIVGDRLLLRTENHLYSIRDSAPPLAN